MKGEDRPSPERAKAWEAITRIPFDQFLFFNGRACKGSKKPTVNSRQ